MQTIFEKFVKLYETGWNAGFISGLEIGAVLVLTLFVVRGAIWLYRRRK